MSDTSKQTARMYTMIISTFVIGTFVGLLIILGVIFYKMQGFMGNAMFFLDVVLAVYLVYGYIKAVFTYDDIFDKIEKENQDKNNQNGEDKDGHKDI